MKNRCAVKLSSLFLICCILLTGCAGTPAQPTETTQPTAPAQTTLATTEPTVPTQPVDPVADSLADLRQQMEENDRVFAAAYFKYNYVESHAELFTCMEAASPKLCRDMPFLLSIPEENIVGGLYGYIYCIVPRDPDAAVTVTQTIAGEDESSAVIYTSDSGDPFLLLCNDDYPILDTQVTISGEGNETVWSPRLDDANFVKQLYNENGDEVILDFTPYAEHLADSYFDMTEWGYSIPKALDLVDTVWGWENEMDGRDVSYLIAFGEDTAYVRWNDGYDEEDHEYPNAPWKLTDEEGFAVLTIDFGNFEGELRFDVLKDDEGNCLYITADASCGYVDLRVGFLSRYMDARSLDAPDPMDMVGNWERFRWETEGYVEEDISGACTIVVKGKTEDSLTISFTDGENRRDFDYQNKPLDVRQGVIYERCGNSLWLAEVDHVGPWDTSYTVTLLEDGTLLLQNYWIMDEAPMVSYEWFRRVG
jgi:hypothetical protein